MTISMNCFDKAKTRFNYSHAATEKFIDRAMRRGKRAEDLRNARERVWLHQRPLQGYRAIAYNGKYLIVSDDDNCITIGGLPSWWGRPRCGDERNRSIRHALRYDRLHRHASMDEECC